MKLDVILRKEILLFSFDFFILIFSVKMPSIPNQVIKYVGSINTPLSMIVIFNILRKSILEQSFLKSKQILLLPDEVIITNVTS